MLSTLIGFVFSLQTMLVDSVPALQLNEVVVTGQFESQSIRNSVYNIRVIDKTQIKLRSATDIKTVLSTELGVRFSNDLATGISEPQLMGMSGASVKILLDGVPMMDRGTAKESLGQIDINIIERIEIVEGPLSVVYGTDAMAGVINIITRNTSDNRLSVHARWQEETAGSEYAFGKGRGSHNHYLGADWSKGSIFAGGSITNNDFGGWQGKNTGRSKEWMPKQQWLSMAKAGYRKGFSEIWYRFNGTDETLHTMGDINNNTGIATDQRYLSNRWFHQLQGQHRLSSRWSTSLAASYTDYARRTQTTNLDTHTGRETLSIEPGTQDRDIFRSVFVRGIAHFKTSESYALQPGIEYNYHYGSGNRIKGTPTISDFAAFISSQWQVNKILQLRTGVRLVKNSVYYSPPVLPSLNAKIKLSSAFDLRLAYARGYRSPILRELYFIFRDASHDIVGNPDLKAETSHSFNGSLSWNKENKGIRLRSTISSFYNNFKNRIDVGQDASVSSSSVYLNIYRFKTSGFEWSGQLSDQQLNIRIGAAYIARFNEFAEDQGTLGELPQMMWSPELNTTLSYHFDQIGTTIGLFYKYTGKTPRYRTAVDDDGTIFAQLGQIDPYHLADFNLSISLGKLHTMNLGVKNLFNITAVRNTSGTTGAHGTGTSVPLLYGRSYLLSLNFNLNK